MAIDSQALCGILGINTLNGDRRQLYYDEPHGRQIDVFIGDFAMCHKLPRADHLHVEPVTIPLAELFFPRCRLWN